MATDTQKMTLDRAVDIIARQCLHASEPVIWEEYPDIGENDWEQVLARMKALTPAPPIDEYRAAYDFLTERGQQESHVEDHG